MVQPDFEGNDSENSKGNWKGLGQTLAIFLFAYREVPQDSTGLNTIWQECLGGPRCFKGELGG